MIDIKALRDDPDFFKQAAKAKNVDIDVQHIVALDQEIRDLKQDVEAISAKKNEASKRMADASDEEKQSIIEEMREIGNDHTARKADLTAKEDELDELLHKIPNPALPDVKVAASEEENEVLRKVGTIPEFTFTPKDHQEIGVQLGIIDKARASRVSGSRFTYLLGDGARLQFALIQHALTITAKYGFTPTIVPHLVSAKAMQAMGYLEHGGHDEIYYLAKDNMYLIGTAEQALGPIHMNEVLEEETLPRRYVGVSPCYRREAGSYGKDTSGIIRVHQFDKVEMFSFTTPENSEEEHEMLLKIEEELMQSLELPYQVIKMVTGDLGLPAARKYDIETWMPTQETYRETHSTSTTTDFQARRLNTKYKTVDGKNAYVHTLNGTAFAIGRIIACILENNQKEDGSVRIPAILQPYLGGQTELKAN